MASASVAGLLSKHEYKQKAPTIGVRAGFLLLLFTIINTVVE